MQINREEKRDILEITKQYYRSMYIVSQCDCLVAGVVSGTNAVLCMPNKFKDTYIFKLGCVTEEDVKEYRNYGINIYQKQISSSGKNEVV